MWVESSAKLLSLRKTLRSSREKKKIIKKEREKKEEKKPKTKQTKKPQPNQPQSSSFIRFGRTPHQFGDFGAQSEVQKT